MIKLEKQSKPQVLQNNCVNWTAALMAAVTKYRGYSNIPKNERDELIKHYRNDKVKTMVFDSSHNKCCFCESKLDETNGYPEIEHFEPKSLYPNKCFEWENLMPICRYCNGSKGNHDTISEPIVNPYEQNPEEFLEFVNLRIKTLNNNPIGEKTIDICDLNRRQLTQARAELFLVLENKFKDILDEFSENLSGKKLNKIKNFLFDIEKLANKESKYSAFIISYLNNSEEYKLIVKYHPVQVGVSCSLG